MEFRRYTARLPQYGKPLSLIASGPNTDEWFWTREFLQEILRKGPGQLREIYGLALHHYAWNLSRAKRTIGTKAKGTRSSSNRWTGTNCCAKASAWKG